MGLIDRIVEDFEVWLGVAVVLIVVFLGADYVTGTWDREQATVRATSFVPGSTWHGVVTGPDGYGTVTTSTPDKRIVVVDRGERGVTEVQAARERFWRIEVGEVVVIRRRLGGMTGVGYGWRIE